MDHLPSSLKDNTSCRSQTLQVIFLMGFALECAAYFLSEQRTELYEKYYSGVAQLKNVLGAKSGLQRRALPGLERHGA